MTTHDAIVSWVLVAIAAIILVFIIVATAHRDKTIPIRYDCALLVGTWQPDFPKEVIETCRKKGINGKVQYSN